MSERPQRLTLGIVANEFFDPSIGRLGGFGWATRQVARTFRQRPEAGVDIVFLSREHAARETGGVIEVHGAPLIPQQESRLGYYRSLKSAGIDLLLSIDYRPSYAGLFRYLPRTPVIVWVRDPRPPDDVRRVRDIQVPGQEHVEGQGLRTPDCTSLASVHRWSRWIGRRILFATPAPFLRAKVPGAYTVRQPRVHILPNIIDLDPGPIRKHDTPRVVFLGRLDPYKRPWIVVEIAKEFPDVEFVLCGRRHFSGPGSWEPADLPSNVRLTGHVEGEQKTRLLRSAWVLINTSAHEGLAVSFLEALRCETPILASVNPQGIAERYGAHVRAGEGTGLDAIPSFREELARLLRDHDRRKRLGREGRGWVMATHSPETFLRAFEGLCRRAGAPLPSPRSELVDSPVPV